RPLPPETPHTGRAPCRRPATPGRGTGTRPTAPASLLGGDHLPPAVRAAVLAGAMALRALTALRTRDHVRSAQGIVSATLVTLGRRGATLRNGHGPGLLPPVTAAARARGA